MMTDSKWQAVLSNDADYDGIFVYGIKTTGVYCRPSCHSRIPKPENIEYFDTCEQAQQAGYRACKRCFVHWENAEHMIKSACAFIAIQKTTPKLQQVAGHVGLSANYFQQLFSEVLGISPRNYSNSHRQQRFRALLWQGDDISSAIYEAGFSASSRVYEFANRYLGMTPRAYQQGGKDYRIWFTVVSCNLGMLLIAATPRGICSVRLGDDESTLRAELGREFYAANLIESGKPFNDWTQVLVNYLSRKSPWPTLPYDLQATAFQRKVWDWLRTIPAGETYNYSDVAKAIGQPSAARAVARACP